MQIWSAFVYVVRVSRRRLRRRSDKARRHEPAKPASAPVQVVREKTHVERLAYTRTQAAAAIGVSRSTFNRRVLPLVETVEMPWGTRLIPVDELERLIAEQRRPAQAPAQRAKRGRPRVVAPELVDHIRTEHEAGRTLRGIASDLNSRRVPTAHGGAQWWPSTVRAVLHRSDAGTGEGGNEPLQPRLPVRLRTRIRDSPRFPRSAPATAQRCARKARSAMPQSRHSALGDA